MNEPLVFMDPRNRPYLLSAPRVTFDERRIEAFEAALSPAASAGGEINYRGEFPKHEFLSYVVDRKGLLLHGTNEPQLEVLTPQVQTDAFGREASAVFATRDAIWPMFFAVVDRRARPSTLFNGCMWLADPCGEPTE